MPVQRVANPELETAVAQLEENNHRVVAITESGDGAFIIVYDSFAHRAAPGTLETR